MVFAQNSVVAQPLQLLSLLYRKTLQDFRSGSLDAAHHA